VQQQSARGCSLAWLRRCSAGPPGPPSKMNVLSEQDTENIWNMLTGWERDGAEDSIFLLYATVFYAVLRVLCELALPGTHRSFTYQQYVLTLAHQALVLPLCTAGWMLGYSNGDLIYLLTGAYLASDSIINYTPVSGCVTPAPTHGPRFKWGSGWVHAHHAFTFVLCALGPNLPPESISDGILCILLGEGGSLWISVTLLWPNPVNFALRFWAFLISRLVAFPIAINMLREVEKPLRFVLLAMTLGLAYDNLHTLYLMRKNVSDRMSRSATEVFLNAHVASPAEKQKGG